MCGWVFASAASATCLYLLRGWPRSGKNEGAKSIWTVHCGGWNPHSMGVGPYGMTVEEYPEMSSGLTPYG